MRLARGDAVEFTVVPVAPTPLWGLAVFAVFGAVTGALGVAYDKAILFALRVHDRADRWSPELRAAAVGAIVGLLLWIDPLVIGGDLPLAQQVLDGSFSMLSWAGVGYLVVRFVLGPLSYSAGTPGGLFAPLLVLGGLWGALGHAAVEPFTTALGAEPALFAIVGMAALFAGSVRAPLTGVVLIAEMTATTSTIVPMMAACAAAMVVAAVVGILAGTWLAEIGGDSHFGHAVRLLNDVLLSAPSILIGLAVASFLVAPFHTFSGWAGAAALALLATPIVTRTTEDILNLQPHTLREAGMALGASHSITVRKIIWKAAGSGLITGALLGFSRISGETAPLLFTALNNQFFSKMSQPTASLSVVMYNFAMSAYDDWRQLAWTAALLVSLAVLIINITGRVLAARAKR
jgi:phosphate transport system permease protein